MPQIVSLLYVGRVSGFRRRLRRLGTDEVAQRRIEREMRAHRLTAVRAQVLRGGRGDMPPAA